MLVVDDQLGVLNFMRIGLKARGFDVTTTTTGEQALALIRSAKPDILLLDIVMPGLDGFAVLRNLRAFTQLPVLAFSSNAENGDGARRLGANDFMCKPFDLEELVAKIRAMLRC